MEKTKSQRKAAMSVITLLLNCVLPLVHTLVFIFLWGHAYNTEMHILYYSRGSAVVILMFFVMLLFLFFLLGAMKIGYYKKYNVIVSQTLGLFCAYVIEYAMISLLAYRFVSLLPMLSAMIAGFFLNLTWTVIATEIYYRLNPPTETIMIYGDSPIDEICKKIGSRSDKYRIVKSVHYEAGEEQLKQEITGYETVILHDISAELRNHLIKYCYERSIDVYVTPKIYDIMIKGAENADLFDTPLMFMNNHGISFTQRILKRLMDLLISAFCLVILSPVMLVIAAAIKLYDGGPVFYRQTRLTQDAKTFEIIKFRSMRIDAEAAGKRLMSKGDDRITPIGKIIRPLHLDELPQVFNILRGEMSFVGPRPERPEIAAEYSKNMPEFQYRLKMKAGLTGYAQVYGKYNSTPYDKLKLDLTYIENYSILLDIRLLLLTGKILFIPDHSEGVEDGSTTALRTGNNK